MAKRDITAKIFLARKVETPGVSDVVLDFAPDYSDGRNKEWASATPALSLTMTVKEKVAKLFEVNNYYTLTFSENVEDDSITEQTDNSVTETAINKAESGDENG
jgi:hypothetical protein